MFLYNIAFSLEFIVLGLGAFLIGWARYKCAKNAMVCETTTRPGVMGVDTTKTCSKHACGTGFAQAIGVILIILAILNFADTLYNSIKFHHHMYAFKQKIEMIRQNQSNSNLNNSNTTPVTSNN